MRRLASLTFGFIRLLIILFIFTIDIKVRADVKVISVVGRAESERLGNVEAISSLKEFKEPIQFETFNMTVLKAYLNSIYIGLGENSHMDLEAEPVANIYRGLALFRVPEPLIMKDEKQWFRIRTPQCDLETSGSEFTVEVKEGRTFLSVLSGIVKLKDRAAGKLVEVKPGFEIWISGLTPRGEHTLGAQGPLSFVEALRNLRELSLLTDLEIQGESDKLRPVWKQAVEFTANRDQNQIEEDFKKLSLIRQKQKRIAENKAKADAELRRYFRSKALPNPDREPSSN